MDHSCELLPLVLFAIIAPATSYPLEYPDAFRIIEIVLPVVTGYLGTAAHHLFAGNPADKPLPAAWPWFRYLVKGPDRKTRAGNRAGEPMRSSWFLRI